jgi:predicted Zn-dependent protease
VISFETGEAHRVEFPEPSYSVYGTGNAEFETDGLKAFTTRFGVHVGEEHGHVDDVTSTHPLNRYRSTQRRRGHARNPHRNPTRHSRARARIVERGGCRAVRPLTLHDLLRANSESSFFS